MVTIQIKRIVLCLLIAAAMLVTACSPTQYTLNTLISPEGVGTITPADGKYDAGTDVTLVAESASGYAFDHWSGDVTGTTNSITITMDSDKSVNAHFKEQYILIISVSPTGGGTVSPASGAYDSGTKVTLTASAAEGYVFDYWSGDATGTSTQANIFMDGDKDVVAHFKKADKTTSGTSSTSSGTGWTISSQEAQQAVQLMLDVTSKGYISITETSTGERLPGPQLPNGVEIPKNAKAGTPTLVNVNGVPAWKVPVLTSNGIRVGEIYVKQIQSTPNRIDFITPAQ
jgi:uncharacterized repeat protein (TIGR02543 family)